MGIHTEEKRNHTAVRLGGLLVYKHWSPSSLLVSASSPRHPSPHLNDLAHPSGCESFNFIRLLHPVLVDKFPRMMQIHQDQGATSPAKYSYRTRLNGDLAQRYRNYKLLEVAPFIVPWHGEEITLKSDREIAWDNRCAPINCQTFVHPECTASPNLWAGRVIR